MTREKHQQSSQLQNKQIKLERSELEGKCSNQNQNSFRGGTSKITQIQFFNGIPFQHQNGFQNSSRNIQERNPSENKVQN